MSCVRITLLGLTFLAQPPASSPTAQTEKDASPPLAFQSEFVGGSVESGAKVSTTDVGIPIVVDETLVKDHEIEGIS